jgi:hypothetical protein
LPFFRPGKLANEAGKPGAPFLASHECRPVDVFVFSEAELEVFFGGMERLSNICMVSSRLMCARRQQTAEFLDPGSQGCQLLACWRMSVCALAYKLPSRLLPKKDIAELQKKTCRRGT